MVSFRVYIAALLLSAASSNALAAPVQALCRGNIETSDKKIVHAGVSYWLWYVVTADKATIRLAGREFTAKATAGNNYTGLWLQDFSGDRYFSFLPADGGTVRAELEDGVWFSGNCLPDSG